MNPVRLALGTLTILPIGAPRVVDRRVAGSAMTLAPLVGVLLGLVPLVLLSLDGPPLLLAVLALGSLTILSRALHLDGLADTADGLGSGARAARALEIMRQSDIGPFGVVTLVLVLLVQISAAASLSSGWPLLAAIVVSRAALPLVCTPVFRAARPDGLGAAVAGTVSWAQLVLSLLLTGGCVVAVSLQDSAAAYSLLGLVLAPVLAAVCARRFGGLTGDVYGACVEVTLAGSLVACALLG